MKKLKIASLLLLGGCVFTMSAGLAACGGNTPETPKVESGSSTTLITDKAPDELSPENVIYAFLQKQSELGSYKITAEGTAVASLAGYEQDIHNITYKKGEDYLNQASSDSVLVKMKHQSFSKNGKVVYRDAFEGDMKVAEKSDYTKVYGFTADDITIGGYIINAKTLRYVSLESTEGDTFTYYMRLAGDQSVESGAATESATSAIRLQSKAYGSLDNLPAYSDVDLTLTIKKDWTPVSYTSSCSYEAKKVFNMSVEQTIVSTYSDINGEFELPDAAAFNDMIGEQPSEVKPSAGEPGALMEMTSALGKVMDESHALALPVSVSIEAFGAPFTIEGDMSLKIKQEALQKGALTDAFTLGLTLDLSSVPFVSTLANTLTVRYPGDGVLIFTLANKTETATDTVMTYTAELGDLFASEAGSEETPSEETPSLPALLEKSIAIEKTETGYKITLQDDVVTKLNDTFENLLAKLEEKLTATVGDLHGYLRSLLDATFTEVTVDLSGLDAITGISVLVKGTPAENITKGENIDVSIDFKLFGGAFSTPFTGDINIYLTPAALLSSDRYAVAQGSLHLDLTPAAPLLQMFGAFGSMIPDIPSWLSADLNSLDVYYLGDGVLTLALNNAAGNPVFMTDLDLKQYFSTEPAPDGETSGESGETGGESGETGGTQGTQGLQLPQIIFEIKENGFSVSLGENLVQALNAAYGALVQTAVDSITAAAGGGFMGSIAGQMIDGWLGAEITGAGIFVGRNDDGKVTFGLTINGKPTSTPDKDYSERALLSITLNHLGELESAEQEKVLALGDTVKNLRAMNEKAAAYDAQVQKFIDEMDVSEDGYEKYVEAVTAMQEKIAAEIDGVKSLMATKSYLAETTVGEGKSTILLLTAELYHERVETFQSKVESIDVNSEEAEWDALNALYEKAATTSGISVPAIKGNKVLEQAVGDATLESYLAKRKTHETQIATELKAEIGKATAAFNEATDREGWTNALTKIVKEFKPVYDKLPDDLKTTTGYQEFVELVYEKNIDEATEEYKTVQSELEELIKQGKEAKIESLLKTMEKLSAAYAWYNGYDYWTSNYPSTTMAWGKTWVTSLKPTWLEETAQDALNQKVTDLIALNRELIQGETEKSVATALKDVIKQAVQALYEEIGDCMIDGEGKAEWDFTKFDSESDEDNAALLEQLHGFRFMLYRVLPTAERDAIWGTDEDLKNFATLNLILYEMYFDEYLAEKAAPQA